MSLIPQRIACLSAETADILHRIGAWDRVVGVSGFTVTPEAAKNKPRVSAFTTIRFDAIESLKPDLVIGFSDLQADAARELGRRGYAVLLTNQRTLAGMFDTVRLLGRIVEKSREAEALAADLLSRLDQARAATQAWARRPRVYFEEWDEPLISGIGWVGELIKAAGGEDAFPELSALRSATERVVEPAKVIERAPEVIIASWCGKKADLAAIRGRQGWSAIPAVRENQVHELESAYCLQPGPILITEGLPRMCSILRRWQEQRDLSTIQYCVPGKNLRLLRRRTRRTR